MTWSRTNGTFISAEYPEAHPYDTALPQDFVDDMRRLTGFEAFGNFVWSYANNSMFGFAYPINARAVQALTNYVRLAAQEVNR